MSRAAEVELHFADAQRMFRLRAGAIRAVQEKCDAGPMELLHRYVGGTWRYDDVREVIYRGLIDGGLPQVEASKLMEHNFDGHPLSQFVPLAQAIVSVVLVGAPDEDEPPGEPQAGATRKSRSRAGKSASATSTSGPAPRATRRAKSTK